MQNSNNRVSFTEDMKKDYTILVPNMLPIQFGLILKIMKNYEIGRASCRERV